MQCYAHCAERVMAARVLTFIKANCMLFDLNPIVITVVYSFRHSQ